MDTTVLTLARAGNSPGAIAAELGRPTTVIQQELAEAGIDWGAAPVKAGRRAAPLLPGQQAFVEASVKAGHSLEVIAIQAWVSATRLRRHLRSVGLYTPRKHTPRQPEAVLEAVRRYMAGDRVSDICKDTGMPPPELYKALRSRDIPLRRAL